MKWSGHLVLPNASVIRDEDKLPEAKTTTDVVSMLAKHDIDTDTSKFKNTPVVLFEGEGYHYTAIIGDNSHYGINTSLIQRIVGENSFDQDGYMIEHLASVFNDKLTKDALSDGGKKNLYFEATEAGRAQDKIAYEVYGPFFKQENDNVTHLNL